MATKMIALVLTAFLFSGFSWGRTETSETPKSGTNTPASTSNRNYDSTNSSYGKAKTQTQAVESRVSKRSGASETGYASARPATASAAAPAGAFPTSLISSLASGDEEERRARIESLRRLSQAMGKMGGQNAAQDAASVS